MKTLLVGATGLLGPEICQRARDLNLHREVAIKLLQSLHVESIRIAWVSRQGVEQPISDTARPISALACLQADNDSPWRSPAAICVRSTRRGQPSLDLRREARLGALGRCGRPTAQRRVSLVGRQPTARSRKRRSIVDHSRNIGRRRSDVDLAGRIDARVHSAEHRNEWGPVHADLLNSFAPS
jgi:hypothetical protein